MVNKIVELRESRNIKQEQLSRELNVSLNTIKNWENGKVKPQASNLRKLALYFGVSTDIFLY